MLTYTPFENLTRNLTQRQGGNSGSGILGKKNVAPTERIASLLGGAALLATGISRRGISGLLLAGLGGALIFRGGTGYCALNEKLGRSSEDRGRSGVPGNYGSKIEKTIQINKTPEELFRFWRNLENLPEFMNNLESVRALDDRHSHWVVKGPAGQKVEWDAEIVNEHPNEMISWQTLPGADVQSAGTVRFMRSQDGQGTLLRVVMEYRAPGGVVGEGFSRLFGKNPEQELEEDLARLKRTMESHGNN